MAAFEGGPDHEPSGPLYVSGEPWWWDHVLYDRFWECKDPPPDPPDWFEAIVRRSPDRREAVVSLIGIRHLTGEVEMRSVTRSVPLRSPRGRAPCRLQCKSPTGRSERGAVFRTMLLEADERRPTC